MRVSEEWQEFKIRLEIITPVIINTGEKYGLGELIIPNQNQEGVQIDLNRLAKHLSPYDVDSFVTEIINRNLRYKNSKSIRAVEDAYKKNPDIATKKVYFSEKAASNFYDSPNIEISKIIEDKLNNRPYIPGSSIKGALRTAILETIRWNKAKNNKIALPDYCAIENNFNKNYESLIMSGNPRFKVAEDAFKYIKVSDFVLEDDSKKLFIGLASYNPTEIYSAMTDSFFTSNKKIVARGTISISSRLQSSSLGQNGLININDIKDCSNSFYLNKLCDSNKYINEFSKIKSSLYNLLYNLNKKNGAIILRIGHYIGIENITLKVKQAPNYKTNKKNNNLDLNLTGGKTLHLIDGEIPAGFCAMYIEEN